MDDDDTEATQATQTALDPRRVGGQNSGFSDEEISDIICILYPSSDAARLEVQRLASEGSPHIIDNHEADSVESDYALEDHPSRFESKPTGPDNHAIILRLSAAVKNPALGFTFGRNSFKCDIVFVNDPVKRVSNIHFRIYINEYGTVMIEDLSMNGTMVDDNTLISHPLRPTTEPIHSKRVLSSGSIIGVQLHKERYDFVFRVRIPRRDDDYDRTYMNKVRDYFARHAAPSAIETVGRGMGGHVNLFRTVNQASAAAAAAAGPSGATARSPPPPPLTRKESYTTVAKKEWTGSGKYNKVGMIGKGAFAVVYKVTSKYDGQPYAAKELEKRRFIKDGVLDAKAENEMRIMKKIQHPNIVQYMEHFELDDRLLVIVMEYVSGGDLGRLIADKGPFSESTTMAMSQQLLSALGYLHKNGITHRDVKPDNILINKTDPLEFKLTDFGLSKMIDKEQTFLRTFCGTLLYCAPEVYTEFVEYDDNGIRSRGKKVRRAPGQRYSHAVDIWSLGGVLFFTLTGAPPYPVRSGISYSELLHQIMTSMLNIQPLQRYGVTDKGIDFLCRMLQRRPEHRATVEELVGHPWLAASISTIKASQTYDVIKDKAQDAPPRRPSMVQHRAEDSDDEIVSDSADEVEERMDDVNSRTPRLFGEIGASEAGCPAELSGTPGLSQSADASHQVYRSAETIRHPGSGGQTRASASDQSLDQLQSLVEEVASQSLGDSEGAAPDHEPSIYSTPSMEPITSKRKPLSPLDLSDEFESATHLEKPIIKRLKSDISMENVSEEMMEEYMLLARLPQVKRSASGRQIDQPVKKPVYWEKDLRTWHLNYPEMTQLQQDAFVQAARDGGEDFAPGKTALWDLAMKFFPSTSMMEARVGGGAADDAAAMPTKTHSDGQHDKDGALGMLIPDAEFRISPNIPIRDSLMSFGRALDNTYIFEPPTDLRVPKTAFKILLWKDGYDPAEDPTMVPPPWTRNHPDAGSYFCWISTKASNGIKINGHTLRAPSSRDRMLSLHPLVQWAKVHDGDALTIWPCEEPIRPRRLLFRCFWGGSSTPRPASSGLELASEPTARQLDVACRETERRVRKVAEQAAADKVAAERGKRRSEAEAEHAQRCRNVERERERSRAFEEKRGEAVRFLASRRSSPAEMVGEGRLQAKPAERWNSV